MPWTHDLSTFNYADVLRESYRHHKLSISVSVDSDVLDWVDAYTESQGLKSRSTFVNALLRSLMYDNPLNK